METGNLIAMILVGIVLALIIAVGFDYLICKSKASGTSPCTKKFWRFWISATSPYARKMNSTYRRQYLMKPIPQKPKPKQPMGPVMPKTAPYHTPHTPTIQPYAVQKPTIKPFSGNAYDMKPRAVY
jgi:hypothetical protein